MNTTTKFFNTKEQYIAFRKAHAAAQNDPRSKKGAPDVYGSKDPGWLQAKHYMLLNIICGKPFYSGFSPKVSSRFVNGGGDSQQALKSAYSALSSAITCAKTIEDPGLIKVPSWVSDKTKASEDQLDRAKKYTTKFLEPYEGTLTVADLASLELPNFNIKIDGNKYVGE